MKKRTIFTLLTLTLACGCDAKACEPATKPASTNEAKPLALPKVSRAERTAIIDSACKALQNRTKDDAGKDAEIPQKLWGEAIAKLHPLRVKNDRVNIFIVLKEDATREEGFYVSNPISSYAPGNDKRFVQFKKLSGDGDEDLGVLYECKIQKEKPDGKAAGNKPVK